MKIAVYLFALTLTVVGFNSNAKSKKSKREVAQAASTESTESTEKSTTPAATPAASPAPTATPVATAAPTPEEKKDDKYKDFSRPVYFAVDDTEVKVMNPKIVYDLRADKGFSLKIADYVFNNDSLKVQIAEDGAMQVTWDKQLVDGGDLSIIDTYGKELWKIKVDNSGDWKFTDWKGKNIPQWKSGDHFRFCLRSEKEKGFASLCTQNYGVEIADLKIKLDYTKSPTPARLIVMNDEKKIWIGEAEATAGAPAQFLATIKTGATYEFMSEPVALNLKDFIAGEQKDTVSFKGTLPAPISKDVKIIPGIEYGSFTKAIGFQKTIAEPVDLWQLDVPVKNAKFLFAGKSGGVFVYNLDIQSYPKAEDRLYVRDNVIKGTYLNKDKVLVRVPKTAQVEGLVALDEKDKEETELRTWEFSSENKYEMNFPQLQMKDDKATHRPYLDVYHGAAGEVSLRLSGLATSQGGWALLGEGHVQYWFNDIFGWQNNYLSKQRWGMSAKYFTSLGDVPADDGAGGTEDVALQSTEVDLRYRFNQGLWGRDETVGAIFAYEALTIGEQKANKIGAGLFWARSMPRVFDRWLNYISFFNHPKYVDMEFIQFFGSTDSDTTMGSDFLINFHGKIMWTKNFFGEAGFGMKNYSFTKADETGAKLTTFYGTLGLGLDF